MLVTTIAKYLGEINGADEWLMASLGQALLIFALPESPMGSALGCDCRKYSFSLGWNQLQSLDLSAFIGYADGCNAVYFGVFVLRSLHPPAAAVALIVVLGKTMGFGYAFPPVFLDSLLLVLTGVAYNNLTGKPYPNQSK